MQIGDTVYVTKDAINIKDQPMKVIDYNVPDFIPYMGEGNVIVEDKDGERFVASRREYETSDDKMEEKFKYVIPNCRNENMKRMFYIGIKEQDDTLYLFNDVGEKIILMSDEYVEVDESSLFDLMYELDGKVESIRSIVDETLSLIKDDIKHNLEKLRN